jgi:hypothetical protein
MQTDEGSLRSAIRYSFAIVLHLGDLKVKRVMCSLIRPMELEEKSKIMKIIRRLDVWRARRLEDTGAERSAKKQKQKQKRICSDQGRDRTGDLLRYVHLSYVKQLISISVSLSHSFRRIYKLTRDL